MNVLQAASTWFLFVHAGRRSRLSTSGSTARLSSGLIAVLAVGSLTLPPATGAETFGLDDVGGGELLYRQGGELVPMPLLDMEVDIQVEGIMATATLTQRFENIASETIEAVYVFPLPDRAALRHMEIRIGDRRIVSNVEERQHARRTYEAAKQEGKKAALVEQERPNLFTTSVANINPEETVEVILEYVEEVGYEDGHFSLTFPLTFTPRYIPKGLVTREESTALPAVVSAIVPDADRVTPPFRQAHDLQAPRATFRATLRSGFPLDDVRCLSHPAEVSGADGTWTIVPEADRVLADRDLRLQWSPEPTGMLETALVTEVGDDSVYGLLMLVPPVALRPEEGLPTRTLFVMDVSGSMAGPSIEQAKQALDHALGRLRPTDRFNILAFNNGQRLYREEWSVADPIEVARAQGWVRGMEANGGTEILAAIVRGIALFGPAVGDEVSRILFFTDGAVGNEAQVLEEVARNLGSIRIHAAGIGHAPNSYFIRKLAERGHGISTFIFDQMTVEASITSFLKRVERPVLSDLELDFSGSPPAEVYPPHLPDLHAGEPLYVSLRWDGVPPGSVGVRGSSAAGPYAREAEVAGAVRERSGVSTRWARARVEHLMDALHEGAAEDTIRPRVVETGVRHHLVTRYTSLVAVEERITARGEARTASVANALPRGSRLLGTLPQGGTLDRLRRLVAGLLLILGAGSFGLYRWGRWS